MNQDLQSEKKIVTPFYQSRTFRRPLYENYLSEDNWKCILIFDEARAHIRRVFFFYDRKRRENYARVIPSMQRKLEEGFYDVLSQWKIKIVNIKSKYYEDRLTSDIYGRDSVPSSPWLALSEHRLEYAFLEKTKTDGSISIYSTDPPTFHLQTSVPVGNWNEIYLTHGRIIKWT